MTGYTISSAFFIAIALDCASTEYFKNGKYEMEGEGKSLSPEAHAKYLAELVARYPIISIEDGMAEGDWEAARDHYRRARRMWTYDTDLLMKEGKA